MERCGPTLSYPRKIALDISKLGLFVSTAHAVQTKISRLTANSLHPPQNLSWYKHSLFVWGYGTYFFLLMLFWVLLCYRFFFSLSGLRTSSYLVNLCFPLHRLLLHFGYLLLVQDLLCFFLGLLWSCFGGWGGCYPFFSYFSWKY